MALDLYSPLVAVGTRFTLVLGVMLVIVSLGRKAWSGLGDYK